MKTYIENLKAKMACLKLNIHQEADALIEFNKLIEYVEQLEQGQTLTESSSMMNDYCQCSYPYPAMNALRNRCLGCAKKLRL